MDERVCTMCKVRPARAPKGVARCEECAVEARRQAVAAYARSHPKGREGPRRCRYCGAEPANTFGPPRCNACFRGCERCGEQIAVHAKMCRKCRSLAAAEKRVCNECGQPCSAKGRRCRDCGYRMRELRKREIGTLYNADNGYVEVYVPDHPNAMANGICLEHRFAMSEHLGRALLPGENVHHKNGVRSDNRIENLELWTTNQPSGQRAVDALDWAREVIATYEPIEDKVQ